MEDNKVNFNGEDHEVPMAIMARVNDEFTAEHAKNEYINTLRVMYGQQDEGGNGGQEDAAAAAAAAAAANNGEGDGNGENGGGSASGSAAEEETAKAAATQRSAWYKELLDAESEDEGKAKIEEFKQVKAQSDKIKNKEQFWNKIESPFAEERDAKITQFKRETGIMGRRGEELADAILLSDIEEIKKDPIKAIAISRMTENPSRLKDFNIDDMVGKVKREAEKYGVDFESENFKDSAEYKDFLMDSMDSVEKIEKFREKFGNYENPFETLHKTREAASKSIEAKISAFKAEISNLGVNQISRKIGDEEIVLEAPKELFKSIPDSTLQHFAAQHDLTTKEGKEALRADLQEYALVKMLESGELEKAVFNAAFKKGQEDIEKNKFNGQSRVIDRTGGKDKSPQPVSEIDARVKKAWGMQD